MALSVISDLILIFPLNLHGKDLLCFVRVFLSPQPTHHSWYSHQTESEKPNIFINQKLSACMWYKRHARIKLDKRWLVWLLI